MKTECLVGEDDKDILSRHGTGGLECFPVANCLRFQVVGLTSEGGWFAPAERHQIALSRYDSSMVQVKSPSRISARRFSSSYLMEEGTGTVIM